MSKLYDIPRDSTISVLLKKGEEQQFRQEDITFHHLDGMFSYCTTKDGDVVHLSVTTPLVLGEDGKYRIEDEAATAPG